MVCISHILDCARTTLGHPRACAGTNCIRKLYHTFTSAEGGHLGESFNKYLHDLAEIGAHSLTMASSLHYDLSDLLEGPLIKKSSRAFWALNKRMPVPSPEEKFTTEEWEFLVANRGKKKGEKRIAADAQLDVQDPPAGPWTREDKHNKIQEYGQEMLDWNETDKYTNWMCHTIAQDLWDNEWLETTYLQVRYVLTEKKW